MRIIILMMLALSYQSADADVFKCTGQAGKTVYQEKPCQAAVKVQQLDIKGDPAKEAEAKVRLETLEAENGARRAERLKAEKEAATQRNQADQVDALNRSALAQQQQAVAQQRQAEALEKQNQQNNNPVLILPGYSTSPRSPGAHVDHDTERMNRRDRQEDRTNSVSPVPSPPR
jgi:hypothetical protein